MHDNRRQFIVYFSQGANVLGIFAFNAQPISENEIGDRNSRSRIFTKVEIVNRMQPPFMRYVRNTTLGAWRRVGREVAIHRTKN